MVHTNTTNTPFETNSPKVSAVPIQKIYLNPKCAHIGAHVETGDSIEPNGTECCHEAYPPAVFTALLSLARDFEEQKQFAIAAELRGIASRGPDRRKDMAHLTTSDVLQAASEHLAEMARIETNV